MHYTCRYTALQFWDTRSPNPMMTIQLPERCYCADVVSARNRLYYVPLYCYIPLYYV